MAFHLFSAKVFSCHQLLSAIIDSLFSDPLVQTCHGLLLSSPVLSLSKFLTSLCQSFGHIVPGKFYFLDQKENAPSWGRVFKPL